MAAEAFAALSIAANIAQFTEYALALVSDCRELYTSVTGARQEHLELENVIISVKERHEDLKAAFSGIDPGSLSKHEAAVLRLAKSCEPIAKTLLTTLERLKAKKGPSSFPKLEALRGAIQAALVGTFRKSSVRDLKDRLLTIENEITRKIIMILNDGQSRLMAMMQTLHETYELRDAKANNSFDRFRNELLIESRALSLENLEKDSQRFQTIIAAINVLSDELKTVQWEEAVLESLGVEELQERESSIKKAQEETLEWIFTDSTTRFDRWLSSGEGIYWIEGKAGSGKSTLMKYISNHPRTTDSLSKWAGQFQLLIARFFFWNSGLPMQKSLNGLLRSLLYQIFCKCQTLMRSVCPRDVTGHWTTESLIDLLDQIKDRHGLESRFCFFIDGLDEYEGEPEDIVSAMIKLSTSKHIKVCTSSRPWTTFIKAFTPLDSRMVLQNYTEKDMITYVNQIFHRDDKFSIIAARDKESFSELPRKVAKKAEGVWLWTYLVTRNMLRDMTGDENYQSFQEKLDGFPSELELYYERILAKLDSVDRREADRILRVAMDAAAPLPVLALRFLAKEQVEPEYALHSEPNSLSEIDMDACYSEWEIKLGNRCRDLLEINTYSNEAPLLRHRVAFLHRTVRDFLRGSYEHILCQRLPCEFNSTRSLCRIMLKLLKSINMNGPVKQRNNLIFTFVENFLLYARDLSMINDSDEDLIDEVDHVVTGYFNNRQSHWSNARIAREALCMNESGHCSFLALTIQAKVHNFVVQKLDKQPHLLSCKRGRPLLDYALRPRRTMPTGFQAEIQDEESQVDLQLVKALLVRNADPNQKVQMYVDSSGNAFTVWSLFLFSCFKTHDRVNSTTVQSWYKAYEILIEHGADVNIKVDFDTPGSSTSLLGRKRTVFEIVNDVFSTNQAKALAKIFVDAHKKKCRQNWGYWLWWGAYLESWEKEHMMSIGVQPSNIPNMSKSRSQYSHVCHRKPVPNIWSDMPFSRIGVGRPLRPRTSRARRRNELSIFGGD